MNYIYLIVCSYYIQCSVQRFFLLTYKGRVLWKKKIEMQGAAHTLSLHSAPCGCCTLSVLIEPLEDGKKMVVDTRPVMANIFLLLLRVEIDVRREWQCWDVVKILSRNQTPPPLPKLPSCRIHEYCSICNTGRAAVDDCWSTVTLLFLVEPDQTQSWCRRRNNAAHPSDLSFLSIIEIFFRHLFVCVNAQHAWAPCSCAEDSLREAKWKRMDEGVFEIFEGKRNKAYWDWISLCSLTETKHSLMYRW